MDDKLSILIVDDDESTCRTLTRVFGKKGYETEAAGTGREALEKARGSFFNLALLDIKLPDTAGIELIAPLKERHPDMMVIMITAYASLETAVQALNEGASAYIIKPLNMDEVLAIVREALEKQRLVMEKRQAEEELQQSYAKLQRALEGTVAVLVSAIEMRDPYTAGHQRRVTGLACAIAREMGLPQEQIEGLRMAGLIHDIGKITIPAEILSKPGQLSDIEWGLIRAHSQAGYNVLKTVDFPWPVAEIVLQHHERLDGFGYPQELSGEGILMKARIMAVADVVEAMSSHRPYRPARGLDEALEEISQNRGILYDTEVVDACLKLFTEGGLSLSERWAKERFPLKELSGLLAPAAQARGLTEEEMMRHVKEARRRIWQERYQEAAHWQIHPEVQKALDADSPVVALESALISHGLPYPQNLETAQSLEQAVRENGAVPATIAIIEGKVRVGLTEGELKRLATQKAVRKVSRRDLPIVVAQGEEGATTVAATMYVAALAGIEVVATGGIGGVHRGQPFDISADLPELAQTRLAVVCSGAKSILDLPLTLEWLETHGVPILGYQTDEFPAFYSRGSGLPVDARVDTPEEAARIIRTKWELGLEGGVLVTVPVPEEAELPRELAEEAIARALTAAQEQGITGKALTPFLLSQIARSTEGASVEANVAFLRKNAAVAARIAGALKGKEP